MQIRHPLLFCLAALAAGGCGISYLEGGREARAALAAEVLAHQQTRNAAVQALADAAALTNQPRDGVLAPKPAEGPPPAPAGIPGQGTPDLVELLRETDATRQPAPREPVRPGVDEKAELEADVRFLTGMLRNEPSVSRASLADVRALRLATEAAPRAPVLRN